MYPELCQCKVQRITRNAPYLHVNAERETAFVGGKRQKPDLVHQSNSSAPLPLAFPGAAPAIPIGQAASPSTCLAVTRESPRKARGSEGRRPGTAEAQELRIRRGKGGEDLRRDEAGRPETNGDTAWEGEWGTGKGGLSRAQGREEVESHLQTAQREALRCTEHWGRAGRSAGRRRARRPGAAGAAVAAASPGARTHVLPPAGSARLSSCRRLVGAGLGPHAWSGLLSLGAPTPRHRSPRAACQPPPLPRPSLGHPGLPRRLLRC